MIVLLRLDDASDVDHPLYARCAALTPGTAGDCPECDAPGVVHSAEQATRVQNQGCPACGYRWQYRFDATGRVTEIRELAGRRLDMLAPDPSDVGLVLDLRDGAEEDRHTAPSPARWWRR